MKYIRVLVVGLLALMPAVSSAQRAPGRMPPRLGGVPRQRLEAEIFDRFMNKVSRDLRLDGNERTRLERHVRQTGQQRRQLAQRSVELRRRLNFAVQDSATSDSDFTALLTELEQLRAAENDLWRNDQEALGRMLTPRQRAVFTLQFMQLNERIRELVQQRPPPADTGR